ncbi:hypothetical protein [Acinetobacter sp. ANC 5414]|uniref:hypothetical protein n=1 Tax=Acinetobacter sp. ANC 5414 TaxID=2731251 RepID=UPI0014903471|nr:hypothetical protein [Acinetobacter sp. ANC 5414]NNG99519.1 hypothetical protein [Acinetobacter sp. ANC 5414]
MHSKLLSLSLITGLMSATAFAEPAIQPGDSLESLSKVKMTTSVNGQAGSIQDLVTSGQIRIVDASQIAAEPTQAGSETQVQTHLATDASQAADINTTAKQTAEPAQATSETEVQSTAAAQVPVNDANENMAAVPVNTAETGMNNEAFAAAPETAQPNDVVQAAPEADVTDAPVNASPEAPAAEQTEN